MKVINEARLTATALLPHSMTNETALEYEHRALRYLADRLPTFQSQIEKATLERAAATAFERAVAGGKPRDIFDAIRALDISTIIGGESDDR